MSAAPPTATPSTVPSRPGTMRLRQQLEAAVAQDQLQNQAAQVIANALQQRGVMPTHEQIQGYVDAIRQYVLSAPTWIEQFWQLVSAHNIGDQADWFLGEVEAYCQLPNDFVPDWFGLMGVVDDAYFVRRMMRGLYERLGVAPDPHHDAVDRFMHQEVLGPVVGARLDQLVAATLAGPAAQQAFLLALHQQAQGAYQQAYQSHADTDRRINTFIEANRPSMNWRP